MELGLPDESGRRKPEIKKDSEEILKADLVIEALGFEPEDLPTMFGEPSLNVTQWGTIKVDYKNLMTSLDGVFAAGDIVRGASLVVWGIKDDISETEVIQAMFPGGSITGAPKESAMSIIDELEHENRHIYTGSAGYICNNGTWIT